MQVKSAVIVFPAPGGTTTFRPPQQSPSKVAGRRNFVKLLITVGAILSLAPYVPWGQFLSSSITGGKGYTRQKIVSDNDVSVNGAAAGKAVNVNDLSTFPPNTKWKITYPSSGDSTVDAQNPDTFVKFELIRLPVEIGGDKKDAVAFVAFSKVCVHLWCSPNYNPAQTVNKTENGYLLPSATAKTQEQYQCPCHGSTYRVPDGLAVAGPASLQPPPTNAIPMLTLSADNNGFLFVEQPLWDVNHNGVLGYGRFVNGVTGP
jgi:Rieske Fe-S protein